MSLVAAYNLATCTCFNVRSFVCLIPASSVQSRKYSSRAAPLERRAGILRVVGKRREARAGLELLVRQLNIGKALPAPACDGVNVDPATAAAGVDHNVFVLRPRPTAPVR